MKVIVIFLLNFFLLLQGTLLANEIPKQESGKAQLSYVASLKQEARGLKGEERIAKLKSVASAYDSVAQYFPQADDEIAEASFRQGEILRSIKDIDGARAAFAKVLENGANEEFAARALLEIGHLHRRAKQYAEAVEAYEKVAADFAGQEDHADMANLWIGKTQQILKQFDPARTAWKKVAENSQNALRRIQAYDLIAMSYLTNGSEEEAQLVLERCQRELAEAAADSSSKGERVKKALEKMRAAQKLDHSDEVVEESEE